MFLDGSLSLGKDNYYWVMSKGTRVPTYLNVRPPGGSNTCGYIDPGRVYALVLVIETLYVYQCFMNVVIHACNVFTLNIYIEEMFENILKYFPDNFEIEL
jgi:hypothetical protein